MSSTREAVLIDAVSKYWVPKECYSSPEALTNWRSLVAKGKFTVWDGSYCGSKASKSDIKPRPAAQFDVQSLRLRIKGQEHVYVKLFPPSEKTPQAAFLGHKPGDHIFRLTMSPGGLQYEGQIPLPTAEYQRQFESVLADIIDMVICALSFVPTSRVGTRLALVPDYLRAIRKKAGKIDQADLVLLAQLWKHKFSDLGPDSGQVRIQCSEVLPARYLRWSLFTVSTAAFLIHKLQHPTGPSNWKPAFEFSSLIQIMERLVGQPMTKLIGLHHDR